jgi:hypothetical protein
MRKLSGLCGGVLPDGVARNLIGVM